MSTNDPLRTGAIFRVSNTAMLRSPMPIHVRGACATQRKSGTLLTSTTTTRFKSSNQRTAMVVKPETKNGHIGPNNVSVMVSLTQDPRASEFPSNSNKPKRKNRNIFKTHSRFNQLVRSSPVPKLLHNTESPLISTTPDVFKRPTQHGRLMPSFKRETNEPQLLNCNTLTSPLASSLSRDCKQISTSNSIDQSEQSDSTSNYVCDLPVNACNAKQIATSNSIDQSEQSDSTSNYVCDLPVNACNARPGISAQVFVNSKLCEARSNKKGKNTSTNTNRAHLKSGSKAQNKYHDTNCEIKHADNRILRDWWIKLSNSGVQVEGILNDTGESSTWHSSTIVKRLKPCLVQTKSGTTYSLTGKFVVEECTNIPRALLLSFQRCNDWSGGFPKNWSSLVQKYHSSRNRITEKPKSFTTATTKKQQADPYVEQNGVVITKLRNRTGKNALNSLKSFARESIDPRRVEEELTILPKSKRGRTIVPPLAYWKGQRILEDKRSNRVIINSGSVDMTPLSADRYSWLRSEEEDCLLSSPLITNSMKVKKTSANKLKKRHSSDCLPTPLKRCRLQAHVVSEDPLTDNPVADLDGTQNASTRKLKKTPKNIYNNVNNIDIESSEKDAFELGLLKNKTAEIYEYEENITYQPEFVQETIDSQDSTSTALDLENPQHSKLNHDILGDHIRTSNLSEESHTRASILPSSAQSKSNKDDTRRPKSKTSKIGNKECQRNNTRGTCLSNIDKIDADSKDIDSDKHSWTTENIQKLKEAVAEATKCRGLRKEIWNTVAARLNLSAEDCCNQYMSVVDDKIAEGLHIDSSIIRDENENETMKTPKLRARPGTLQARREIRDLLEYENKGHVDDIFDSTPLRDRDKSHPILEIQKVKVVPELVSGQKRLKAMATPETSILDTPGLFRKVNFRDVDSYIGRSFKHRREKRLATNKNTRPSELSFLKHELTTRELAKHLNTSSSKMESPCTDNEDYYFSE